MFKLMNRHNLSRKLVGAKEFLERKNFFRKPKGKERTYLSVYIFYLSVYIFSRYTFCFSQCFRQSFCVPRQKFSGGPGVVAARLRIRGRSLYA